MYKVLELKLTKIKPIFDLDSIQCMYDSGAMFPVWCSSLEIFNTVFPEAVKLDKQFPLGGFGGDKHNAELVDIYRIPEVKIHSDDDELVFKNLYVAMSLDKDFGCDLILSDTMFDKMSSMVDRLNPNKPMLRIVHPKNEYRIAPIYANSDVVTGIYNFTQSNVFSK